MSISSSTTRNVMLLLISMWVMLCMSGFNIVAAHFLQEKRAFVEISNNLSQGLDLTVQCKSKNNDLGARKLKRNGTYKFNFRPNFVGTTLFFCKFQWKDPTSREDMSRWFNIYDYDRDSRRCKQYCHWMANTTAACLYKGHTEELRKCFDYRSS